MYSTNLYTGVVRQILMLAKLVSSAVCSGITH
jgi:hypothetical protein